MWYGRQGGVVYLSDRKVRVERPRLRRRGAGEGGEVEVPAYAAMRRPGAVADRMLEVLMAGVSTRKYGRVIGEMADTVGVSKSAVSRETVEASERVLKELMERRLDAWDLLVIYLDGIQMGSHHVLAAVGVDSDGKKHVLGVREGASENAEVTSALLEDLVERGLDPGRRRLFVIDGSKASAPSSLATFLARRWVVCGLFFISHCCYDLYESYPYYRPLITPLFLNGNPVDRSGGSRRRRRSEPCGRAVCRWPLFSLIADY